MWQCWCYRHGIRQLRSGWADGPAYVTQCPIQTGQSYVYNFTVTGQRGTLFWHAHISWLRATLYGPIIILPKKTVPYPFVKPYKEVPIVFGEQSIWWTPWWSSTMARRFSHSLFDYRLICRRMVQHGYWSNSQPSYTNRRRPKCFRCLYN